MEEVALGDPFIEWPTWKVHICQMHRKTTSSALKNAYLFG